MKKIICLVITLLMTLPADAKLTAHEEARINAMLEGLAQKKDLIFVRNGDEHTCDEAVSHLRRSWAIPVIALILLSNLLIRLLRHHRLAGSRIS
ncbi:hypothetical protein Ef18B226LT_29230 [Escherichia fergusonii]|nr:hypothetical protein Ef30038_32630 [Escherichia fergusonii]BES14344.1 hypothetical protein Ef18B226LT_29230 [Escherichia fergusonii]